MPATHSYTPNPPQSELEDLCFAVLQPTEYRALRRELDELWGVPSIPQQVGSRAKSVLRGVCRVLGGGGRAELLRPLALGPYTRAAASLPRHSHHQPRSQAVSESVECCLDEDCECVLDEGGHLSRMAASLAADPAAEHWADAAEALAERRASHAAASTRGGSSSSSSSSRGAAAAAEEGRDYSWLTPEQLEVRACGCGCAGLVATGATRPGRACALASGVGCACIRESRLPHWRPLAALYSPRRSHLTDAALPCSSGPQ